MNLILGGVGTCMAFFGIFMNLYVIIVLLLNKKARTSSEWILLHLSWCGLGASFFNLCLISPSIFMARWLTSTGSLCSVVGASVLTLQLLTVWSICALSADRCAAIASPLRYTQLVTGRRVAIFFLIIWMLSIGTAMTAFIVSTIKDENSVPVGDNNKNDNKLFEYQQSNSSSNSSSSISFSNSINYNTVIHQTSRNNINITTTSSLSSPPGENSSLLPDLRLSSGGDHANFHHTNQASMTYVNRDLNSSSPTVANMIFDLDQTTTVDRSEREFQPPEIGDTNLNYSTSLVSDQKGNLSNVRVQNESLEEGFSSLEFRRAMGLCLPRVYYTSLPSVLWVTEWIFVILVAPLCTILVCDLVVLSIARKQRHRIVMALYQITLSAQATVVRSKGTTTPPLWLNRSIPARSRACRAVLEDLSSLLLIHLPLILILVFEMLADDHRAPMLLHFLGSVSLFLSPSFTALLYGIRARSLRAAYKSYIRKRMTNNTLQHEIQQRLSPVDGGSPRPSSGAKSFRSYTPSPATSPVQTPRRLSTNDLRPPPMHFPMNPLLPFPSSTTNSVINNNSGSQEEINKVNNHNSLHGNHFNDNGCLGNTLSKPRKIRSFLHLTSHHDMQEFWSGLRRPNRSPTIIITHEIRLKENTNSPYDSKASSPTAEQRL